MSYVLLAVGVLALTAAMLPVLMARSFTRRIGSELGAETPSYLPKAALVVPCKGLDPGFAANIESLFRQDYPSYQIVFVTTDSDDPAYAELERLMSKHPNVNARLETAGVAQGRSGKVNCQLRSLEVIDADVEVLVFVDSDARPEPEFLRFLIGPLGSAEVGMSTGFRWYMPVKGGVWSVLRSAWNGGGVVFIADPKASYAWGGAMAIRRDYFEKLEVARKWQKALSDDMVITRSVREAGLKIRFVPECLVATHEDCSFSEMLEWTNRQTIISRIYHPPLWRSIGIAHGLGNVVLFLGAGLLVGYFGGWLHDPVLLVAGGLMLAMAPMEMLGGVLLLPAVTKMLPREAGRLRKLAWMYVLLAPPASMLALVNTVYSLFTRRITWRGTTYEMRSPEEVIVIDDSRAKSPSRNDKAA